MIKAGALCDNAIIKCKGSVKNLSFPVFVFNGCRYVVVIGCDTMEFLLYNILENILELLVFILIKRSHTEGILSYMC